MALNLTRLEHKLRVAIPKAMERNVRAAMEESAGEIVAMMKALVPYDSGDLHDSIGWAWGGAPKGSKLIAKAVAGQSGMVLTIYAGDDEAFYAHFIEWGTQKMKAQPFFFPSFRARQSATRSKITKAVKEGIREGAR